MYAAKRICTRLKESAWHRAWHRAKSDYQNNLVQQSPQVFGAILCDAD